MSSTPVKLTEMPYVTLWAHRFDQVVRLYRDTLGLPVAEASENFVMFDTQGARVAFHRLGEAPPLARDAIELHFTVADVDAAYEALSAEGIAFRRAPANKPWGQRQAGFKDPEGFDVELVGPTKEGEPIESY